MRRTSPNGAKSAERGIPLQGKESGGIPLPANFAPLGLVRRIVEMLLRAGISPRVGTSPRWGSCAASSKCSCKQAFLLASGGMTDEGWGLTVSCPPCVREGAERSEAVGL